MAENIFLFIYTLVSLFMLVSVYFGLFKPHNNSLYGVFCRIIANDKMLSYTSQLILTILVIALLSYIEWYFLAAAVAINTIIILSLEFYKNKIMINKGEKKECQNTL